MEVRPGTPSAGELEDGDTHPRLPDLGAGADRPGAGHADQADTRKDLQRLLEGYGEA